MQRLRQDEIEIGNYSKCGATVQINAVLKKWDKIVKFIPSMNWIEIISQRNIKEWTSGEDENYEI